MSHARSHSTSRRAFSLIETALATAIVGGLMVAVIDGVGASVKASRTAGDRQRAALLAAGLLDEAATLAYVEPGTVGTPPALGVDDGEALDKRVYFNDVDDFDGVQGTPTDPSGNVLSGAERWTWTVTVNYVDASGKVAEDTGLKRIVVEVRSGDKVLARLTRFRSAARDAAAATTVTPQTTPAYADTQTITGVEAKP